MAEQHPEEPKIYPGNLDRYRTLRARREQVEAAAAEAGSTGGTSASSEIAALSIAEELAGLAYILDGIRYAARKN